MRGRINKTGSLKINGLLEEYKVASGGNINAGDFVKWVDKYVENNRVSEELSDIECSTYYPISCVGISNNKVFIIYNNNTSYIYNSLLHGIVCIFNETGIIVGTDTIISSRNGSGQYKSVATLSENKVIIAYTFNSASNYPYARICTIEGTDITVGTETQLLDFSAYGKDNAITRLSEDKVFIYYSRGQANTYGHVCTITNDEIHVGEYRDLNINGSNCYNSSAIALSENKVFLLYTSLPTGNIAMYGKICTINGEKITAGTAFDLLGEYAKTFAPRVTKLSENKVFIAYTNTYAYGLICDVNESNIIPSLNTKLDTISLSNGSLSVLSISSERVILAISSYKDSTASLYKIICSINETGITTEEKGTLINTSASITGSINISILNANERLFIAHGCNQNGHLEGTLFGSFENGVHQLENNTDTIFGVAKTKGVAGQMVKVYVPDVEAGGVAFRDKILNFVTKIKSIMMPEVYYAR